MIKLISYKVDFKRRKITRNKEEYYFTTKTQFLNVYAPSNRASKHIRQILIELIGEIDKSVCTDGQFKILTTND